VFLTGYFTFTTLVTHQTGKPRKDRTSSEQLARLYRTVNTHTYTFAFHPCHDPAGTAAAVSGKEALYQHAKMAVTVLLQRCTGAILPVVPTGADRHFGRLLLHMVGLVRLGPLTSADADWLERAAPIAALAASAMLCCDMSTSYAWDPRWSIVLLRWRVVDATLSMVRPVSLLGLPTWRFRPANSI
jgi:hypothetical protein